MRRICQEEEELDVYGKNVENGDPLRQIRDREREPKRALKHLLPVPELEELPVERREDRKESRKADGAKFGKIIERDAVRTVVPGVRMDTRREMADVKMPVEYLGKVLRPPAKERPLSPPF